MSSWPDVSEDTGYTKRDNKNKGGSDFGVIRNTPTVQDCMAACNSTSACKSFAYAKNGSECWLKSVTENDGNSSDNNWDMYYKTGNTNIKYTTKPGAVNGFSGSGWDNMQGPLTDPGTCGSSYSSSYCSIGYAELNGAFDTCGGSASSGTRVMKRTCGFAPKATNVCPNLGMNSDDLRYVKHDTVTDLDYRNGGWGGAARDQNFYKGSGITCGYNRIKKSEWPNLGTYFDNATADRIKNEYCRGPGVNSTELFNDNECRGFYGTNRATEYFGIILDKLKAESNWWNDVNKVRMFENIAKNASARSNNDQKFIDVINSLPSTGWSDDLVKCLNAIIIESGTSGPVLTAIRTKTAAYCQASNRNSNDKCGCFNAIDYGIDNCPASATGCADVAQFKTAIDQIATTNPGISTQLKTSFTPHTDAGYCRRAVATDTVLKYERTPEGASSKTYAYCFNGISNTGTINADTIRQACNINVQSGSGGSPSSTSPSPSTPSIFGGGSGSGDEEEGKNNTMLIILLVILCCCSMLLVGGGLVLAL